MPRNHIWLKESHSSAWLASGGVPIIGGENLVSYKTFCWDISLPVTEKVTTPVWPIVFSYYFYCKFNWFSNHHSLSFPNCIDEAKFFCYISHVYMYAYLLVLISLKF